jgi:gluconate:H+ symporter, GntP family
LPAVAGFSVLHALVPPHPGPMIAVHELGANVGRTLLRGVLVGVPTAIVAGPLYSRWIAPRIDVEPPPPSSPASQHTPSLVASLFVLTLPVVLITLDEFTQAWPMGSSLHGLLAMLGAPVVALLLANLLGLALLLPAHDGHRSLPTNALWTDALAPAGAILLSIGAGGAFKQVLVDIGLAQALLHLLGGYLTSPILLGWMIAAAVRVATGSATVATITAAGLMAQMGHSVAFQPEWAVLAIGAGSIFFSHVNDGGFWLVKGFLGTTTTDTFATWSVLETMISVMGLLLILLASHWWI